MSTSHRNCIFQNDDELGAVLTKFVRHVNQATEALIRDGKLLQNLGHSARGAIHSLRQSPTQSTSGFKDVRYRVQNVADPITVGAAVVGAVAGVVNAVVAVYSVLTSMEEAIVNELKDIKSINQSMLAEFQTFKSQCCQSQGETIGSQNNVRDARERLISLLGTDRGVEELVRHVENAGTRDRAARIFGEIRTDYGEQAEIDVWNIVQARYGLRVVRNLMGETTQAYKDAAAARTALTATEEEGLQTQQKATRTLEQQAEAAQQLVDVTLTQDQATKRTTTAETVRNRGLLLLTQQTGEAFVQVSNVTDQLDELTTATANVTCPGGLQPRDHGSTVHKHYPVTHFSCVAFHASCQEASYAGVDH